MIATPAIFTRRRRARARPMKKISPEGLARRAAGRRALLDPLVREMHAAYMGEGLSIYALARRYDRTTAAIRGLFEVRGLPIRPWTGKLPRRDPVTGQTIPRPRPSPADLERILAAMTSLRVPAELKLDWREWPLEQRGAFIARYRQLHPSADDRPAGPFSANVVPFDYASPRAWEIVDALNRGRDSHRAAAKLDICTQGVIWDDRLWFWSPKCRGYYAGRWRPGIGRPALHRVLWEQTHRRPIPPGHVVGPADGNLNNLDPANLVLRTRREVAIANRGDYLAARSRDTVALLLARSRSAAGPSHSESTTTHHGHHTHTLRQLRGAV